MRELRDSQKSKVVREETETPRHPLEEKIDIQLRIGSVAIQSDDYTIDDDIPIIQNRKAAFYIWDVEAYRKRCGEYPQYHIINCETLKEMKADNRFGEYRATRQADSTFETYSSSNDQPTLLNLGLCEHCLYQVKEKYGDEIFFREPPGYLMEFPLGDWLEVCYDDVPNDVRHIAEEDPFSYLSESWKVRSLNCRERAEWKCEACGIDLKDDSYFLHAHHKWGRRFNEPEDLMALCIGCHAEQPGDGHRLLKSELAYQGFVKKYRYNHRRAARSIK